MKTVSITEAKNRLSALIDSLRGGTGVLIVDRGRPVARLEPVTRGRRGEDDGRLNRLVRDGIVRAGSAVLARSLLAEKPPRARGDASVLKALLDERQEGR
jgi:prevent-host-death family protein